MTIWIDIGIGILIGLLLGTLVAGLILQAVVNRRAKPVPELLKRHAELNTQLQAAQAATDQAHSEADQLRTELTQLRRTSEEHRQARVSLANEQTNLKMQLSTIQSMLASASSEKERILMDVIMLRTENETLRTQLGVAGDAAPSAALEPEAADPDAVLQDEPSQSTAEDSEATKSLEVTGVE